MKVNVSEQYGEFIADPVDKSGMPTVGRGKTLLEALGAFLITYQSQLGVVVEIEETAAQAEIKRRATANS